MLNRTLKVLSDKRGLQLWTDYSGLGGAEMALDDLLTALAQYCDGDEPQNNREGFNLVSKIVVLCEAIVQFLGLTGPFQISVSILELVKRAGPPSDNPYYIPACFLETTRADGCKECGRGCAVSRGPNGRNLSGLFRFGPNGNLWAQVIPLSF